ncbi:MAG: leucyl aminopeptidase family protein [Flammeovirgaceae bacterium]
MSNLTFVQNFPEQLTDIIVPVIKTATLKEHLAAFADQIGFHSIDFEGNPNETRMMYGQVNGHTQKYYLVGLGEHPAFHTIVKTIKRFVHEHKHRFNDELGIEGQFLFNGDLPAAHIRDLDATLNGLYLGTYEIGLYKTQKSAAYHIRKLYVNYQDSERIRQAAAMGTAIAETQMRIMDMVNAPSNKLTPELMGDWVIDSAKQFDYQVKVYNKKEIEALGMHTLLAVNKGSVLPPALIVAEYKPKNSADLDLPKVGLVGKGITFDTGGLSIKTQGMHYMKSDMGGAAAVLGALEVAAKLQLPVHIITVVPASENNVDAHAINPGDIIDSYLGKTIEVIDTDAEGRLVLADGLAYLNQNYDPDVLIDVATLTGSTVRTFGYHAGALFSHNEELTQALLAASERTGERIWQLPLWDVYQNDLKSDVADIKNFSGLPMAGAIIAAKFLENFIEEHPKWAHLDIASVAFGNTDHSSMKSATGFGVRLLIDFMQELANNFKALEQIQEY